MSRHLVVVDMQRVFADPDSGWFTPGFGGIVPTVAALVRAFTPEVTFTRFVAPAEPTGAWRTYYERWAFALQPPDAPLWDVVPELQPTGPTVNRTTFSTWGPELADRVGAGRCCWPAVDRLLRAVDGHRRGGRRRCGAGRRGRVRGHRRGEPGGRELSVPVRRVSRSGTA